MLTATRIDSGATITFTSTGPVWADYAANNTLVFTGTPGAAGQFKFETSTVLTSTAVPTSTNFDAEAASLTIVGAVSNGAISVIGDTLANGEFTVV